MHGSIHSDLSEITRTSRSWRCKARRVGMLGVASDSQQPNALGFASPHHVLAIVERDRRGEARYRLERDCCSLRRHGRAAKSAFSSLALMTVIEHSIVSVPETGSGQDRAAAVALGNGLLVALADGAGGASNGALAAQAIVDVAARGGDPVEVLIACDERLQDLGLATAVLANVTSAAIVGASVGDSGAWLIGEHDVIDLTEHQHRKPL